MKPARPLLFRWMSAIVLLTCAIASPILAADPGASFPTFRRAPASQTKSVPPSAPQEKRKDPQSVGVAQPNVTAEKTDGDQVDVDEVARRGDSVIAAGRGPMATNDAVISEALSPPPDDSHKWFFSVIVDGSKESETLLYDLKHSSDLRAWLKIDDPAQSWAHVTVYVSQDQTQDWRWAKLKISRYPVMIFQPPAKRINESSANAEWEWGDPKTVIWQWDGYDATAPDRAKLRANAIRSVATSYAKKIAQDRNARRQAVAVPSPGPRKTEGPGQAERDVGATPFALPALPASPSSNPVFPSDPMVAPSQVAPAPNAISDLVTALLGKFLGPQTTGFWMAIVVALKIWQVIAARTKTPVDDQIVDFFRGIVDQANPIKIDQPK